MPDPLMNLASIEPKVAPRRPVAVMRDNTKEASINEAPTPPANEFKKALNDATSAAEKKNAVDKGRENQKPDAAASDASIAAEVINNTTLVSVTDMTLPITSSPTLKGSGEDVIDSNLDSVPLMPSPMSFLTPDGSSGGDFLPNAQAELTANNFWIEHASPSPELTELSVVPITNNVAVETPLPELTSGNVGRSEMPYSLQRLIKNNTFEPASMQREAIVDMEVPENTLNNVSVNSVAHLVNSGNKVDPTAAFGQGLMAQFAQSTTVVIDTEGESADWVSLDDAETIETTKNSTLLAEAMTKAAVASPVEKTTIVANVRVGMPGWADQIAARTASLVSQNIKQAEIQLNPQDMGPINIKISLSQDQAAVTFVAQNPQVRDALEQSLQRLRETLANDGFDLIQADVHDQPRYAKEQQERNGSGRDSLQQGVDDGLVVSIRVVVPESAVDHFV